MEWIKCSERLPDKEGLYLIYNSFWYDKRPDVAYFSHNLEEVNKQNFCGENRPGFYHIDCEYFKIEGFGVTHWMPFPEPPEE